MNHLLADADAAEIAPLVEGGRYAEPFALSKTWFAEWGFWAVFVAGFSPIPYKVFTIAAGSLAMNLPLFIVGSLIGRGGRFFLVASLLAWGGPKMEAAVRSYIERIGWALVVTAVLLYLYFSR